MSVTIFWLGNSVDTSYALEKSTDKGISYTDVATVTFDVNGSHYDKQKKQFFYADDAGNPGDIYRITSTGAYGISKPTFVIAPPESPPTCVIIGYLMDVFGYVDQRVSVHVTAFGSPGEKWVQNPVGVVAQNTLATGLLGRSSVVNPTDGGIWQVELVQGAYARIEIPELDFSWTFEVPKQTGPLNIRDISQLRGQDLALFPEMLGERNVLPNS